MSEKNTSLISKINVELNTELNKETYGALIATTFKGFNEANVKKAIMEGMIRGLTFRDFLEKNVYAIPFGAGYTLISSIDSARKKAMKNGLIGKSKPILEFNEDGKVISCEITVKRVVSGTDIIGEFTALVYFSEYNTGKNQWAKKPITMISKVAEFHALRMGFPEDLSGIYSAEEMEKDNVNYQNEDGGSDVEPVKTEAQKAEEILKNCKTLPELQKAYLGLSQEVRRIRSVAKIKDDIKAKLTEPKAVEEDVDIPAEYMDAEVIN